MDQPLSRRSVHLRMRSRVAGIVVLLATLVGAAWGVNRLLTPSLDLADVRVADVVRGDIANTINASGVVVPVREELITSPVQSRVLHIHVKPGEQVAAGQLLLELDDSTVVLEMDRLREQIAQQDNRIEGLRLDLRQKQKQLASDIELLMLDLERHKVQLDRYRRLGALGATSASDLSAAELAVRRSEIQLRQYRESLADNQQLTDSSIEGARLQKSILDKQLQQQLSLREQMQVRAPFDGMLGWLPAEEGSSVAAGAVVARISGLDDFMVEASVSDFYARYLSPGQAVRIGYSGQTLDGEVQMILPEIVDGIVKLTVTLAEPDHPMLRNKLRVEAAIVTDQRSDVLIATAGPAFNGQGRQAVWLLRGDHAVRTDVEVGLGDGHHVELVSGARAGDRLVVSDLSRFDHLERIRITD